MKSRKASLRRGGLWKVSLMVGKEAEEAVVEFVQNHLVRPATAYARPGWNAVEVALYLEKKPEWGAVQRQLRQGLEGIENSGLSIHPGKISMARIPQENWAESWKRHFKPLGIGRRRLVIVPSWSKRIAEPGQAVVVLDPGLSFGTGNHPTTAYCLEELVSHRMEGRAQAMLDLGTGSGILAIAAARLGFSPIEAIDVDADAVRIARTNAQANKVQRKVVFSRKGVESLRIGRRRKGFSVVCANLISTLLIQERVRIAAAVEPGGKLVLAGILKAEFSRVNEAYQAAGMRLKRSRTKGEWRSGTWTKDFE